MQFPNIYFIDTYHPIVRDIKFMRENMFPRYYKISLFIKKKYMDRSFYGKTITNIYLRIIKYMRFYFNICGHK